VLFGASNGDSRPADGGQSSVVRVPAARNAADARARER